MMALVIFITSITRSPEVYNYSHFFKGDAATLMRSRTRPMWVFQKELMDQYSAGRNAPYGSTLHRIERYRFPVSNPDAEVIAYRILHTRPKM